MGKQERAERRKADCRRKAAGLGRGGRGAAGRGIEQQAKPPRRGTLPAGELERERDEEGAGGELSCLNQRREEESSSKAALRWTGLEDWMERGETRTTLDC